MAISVEKQIKDLEQRISNAEIRHKRLQAEVSKSIDGLLKSIGKHQAETYKAFRAELAAKTAEERKKTEKVQKQADDSFAARHKEMEKKLTMTHEELKKLLR